MDEDRVAGSAERAQGSAKQAAGNLFGDVRLQAEGAAERAAGAVREAAGAAREAAEDSPAAEVRHLREEVDGIAVETAVSEAKAESYARRADAAVDRRIEAVADVVRDHPLLAAGGAALLGYLLGRLTGGATHIYRR